MILLLFSLSLLWGGINVKKIYIITTILTIVGISSGILFFVIRDAVAKIPDDISLVTSDGNPYIFGDADKKLNSWNLFIQTVQIYVRPPHKKWSY